MFKSKLVVKMRSLIALALTLAAASATTPKSNRILGGSLTTINQYPEMAQLLRAVGTNYFQDCAGIIINNRAILSAAHCTIRFGAARRRVRVGSSFRSSGGTVLTLNRVINHPNYNQPDRFNHDISILWVNGNIPETATSRPALLAGANYYPADNQVVWAAGWGYTIAGDWNSMSEQLHHVQIWTVNQAICRQRYADRVVMENGIPQHRPFMITDNMLCSGWLDVGGRDQCPGDSGGPLYHNGVVVGVCSFGDTCGSAHFPGVNARVSRYIGWINQNR